MPPPRPLISAPCAGSFPGCPQGPRAQDVVQERLRVEQNARRGMSPFERSSSFAPLPQTDGPLAAHLRLNGGFGGPGARAR